jgi:hydroxyacylglutathione hydrolase
MAEEIKVLNLGFVNAFLVKITDGFILIDTGLCGRWKKLESELTSAGCLPDKLRLVILTHGDSDHAGNCKKLQEKYHAKISMHKSDFEMVELGIFKKRMIMSLGLRILFFIRRVARALQKNKENPNKFKPDLFLIDGQSLEEHGFDAKIIHIPGHTKGSIAIFTKEKNLFVGDTIVNQKQPTYATIIEDENELRQSVKKLKSLDAKTVYVGHGKPFSGKLLDKVS